MSKSPKEWAARQEQYESEPCLACQGQGGEPDESGNGLGVTCSRCRGAGEEPEELDAEYVEELLGTTVKRTLLTATIEIIEEQKGEPWATLAARLRMHRADQLVVAHRLAEKIAPVKPDGRGPIQLRRPRRLV